MHRAACTQPEPACTRDKPATARDNRDCQVSMASSSTQTPLEAARAELLEQGQHQAECRRLIEEKQAELDRRIAARKGKGSGRLSGAEQKKDDDLNAVLVNQGRS